MVKKSWQGKNITPKNIPLKNLLIPVIILNLAVIALVIFLQSKLPPEVPLFYGLAEGQEQLASSLSLIIPPVISLVIILVNTGLSLLAKNALLKNFLVAGAVATSLLSTTTVVKIVFLVGSF